MNLCVVIVSFNTLDLMVKTLDSLKLSLDVAKSEIPSLNYEVIVVDNASTDGVVDLIEKDYKWAKLIKNSRNLGFSKANNLGIHNAHNKPDYFLFLNNDVILDNSTIKDSISYIKNENNIGILSCYVELWSGGIDIDCHRAFPTIWNSFCYFSGLEKYLGKILPSIFGRYHMLYKNLKEIHEIDLCLGAFMLVPKNVGDKINWWPEEYFMNGEDVDFCYQIKNILKLKIVYNPHIRIIHYKGASKGTKKVSADHTKADNATINKQINAGVSAMKIFYKKYYAEKNLNIVNIFIYTSINILAFLRRFLKSE